MAAPVTRKEFDALVKRVELLEEDNKLFLSILDQIKTTHNSFPNGIDIQNVDYIGTIISNNI